MSTGEAAAKKDKKVKNPGVANDGTVKATMIANPGDGSPVPNIPDVVDIPADYPYTPPPEWAGDKGKVNDTYINGTLPGKDTNEYENAVATQEAQAKENERRRRAFGFANTQLTGPLGLTNKATTTGKKTLLGA